MRRRDMGERAPLSKAAAVAFQTQLRIAVLLSLTEQEATVGDLAQRLGCSKTSARAALDPLEEVGLVQEVRRETGKGGQRPVYGVTHTGWPEMVDSLEAFLRTRARQ